MEHSTIKSKIFTREELAVQIDHWKLQGHKIVFTNGCFDLLHKGHVLYLETARQMGDKLVVGLNDDASVTRIKGPNRPIQLVDSRMHVLAALNSVDGVAVFTEDDPLNLIQLCKPDFLVKGGDWPAHQIVGSEFVQSYGGEVCTIAIVEGHSTTNLEEKIKTQ